MKKIVNLLIPVLTGVLLLVSCKQDDTDGFTLYGFNPNPAVRGEQLSFYGEGLDAVTSVVFAGGAETSEITRNGTSISVVIPMEAQPGYIELRFGGGSYLTRSALTLEEPLANDAEILSYTDFDQKTNGVTTVGSKLYLVTAAETDYLTDIIRVEFEGDGAVVEYDADAVAAAEEETADETTDTTSEEYLLGLSEKVDFVRGAHLLIVTIPQSARSGAVGLYNSNEDRFEARSVEIAQSAAESVTPATGVIPGVTRLTVTGENFGLVTSVVFTGGVEIAVDELDENEDPMVTISEDGTSLTVLTRRGMQDGPLALKTRSGEVIATPGVETVVPTSLSAWSDGDLFKAGKAMTLSCNDTEDAATNYEILKQIEKVIFISPSDPESQNEAAFTLNDDYRCLDLTAPAVCGARSVAIVTCAGKQQTVIETLDFATPAAQRADDAEIHAGDELPLTGEHLDLITKATIGNVTCDFTSGSETEMTVTVDPTCTSGDLVLHSVDPSYSITLPLTVLPTGRIAVTALPESAAAGEEITIEGSGFNLVESILLGETKVIAYSFRSDTKLTFTVPEGTPAGTCPLTFTLTDGTSETSARQITIGTAPSPEKLLWSGSHNLGLTWEWDDRFELGASAFAGLPDTFTLQIEFEEDNANATYWQLKLMDLNQTLLSSPIEHGDTDPAYNTVSFQEGQTSYSIALSADDVTLLKNNGLLLSGYGITLTAVRIPEEESGSGDEPGTGSGEIVLMDTPKELTSWSSENTIRFDTDMGYDVSVFADCTTQTLFTLHLSDLGASPQIKIVDKSWALLPSANVPLDTEWGIVNLDPGQSTYTFSLDESDLEKVKSNGMIIDGQNITVTKVTMKN